MRGEAVTNTRPEFERPPLAEQAITVIFDRLPRFALVDFGLLWRRFEAEFPVTMTSPMRDPVIERFDDVFEPQIQFKLMAEDTLPRAIFRSEAGHEQIQIQPDLFVFNWLKVGDAPYPRSERLVERFIELFERFCEHVSERGLGEVKINHCELVNVNIVPVSDFGNGFEDVTAFFNVPDPVTTIGGMDLESYQLQAHYVFRSSDGRPFGRLRQSLVPVSRIEDGQKAYRFELTARGNPDSGNLKDSLSFFGKGRDAINAAFVVSTTPAAHTHWGLK